MKKKGIIIGILAVVVLAAVAAILLFCNKKITISFDTDGAEKIAAVEIKKGGTIKLPSISKEGYVFGGWYLGEKAVDNGTTYDEDVTLKAKWISEEAKTLTVTFDSDGGSEVESITLECGTELSLPTNPTKKGYTFVSWIDSNENPITDKALLECEDITLKANWKKEETKKTDNKKTETKKTYTCPSDYTLDGKKCISKIAATLECPSDYTWNSKANTCAAKTNPIKKCNKHDNYGDGALIGSYCYHGVYPPYNNDKANCEAAGYYYVNDYCRVVRTNPEVTCPSGYKLYHSDPNFGIGDQCVKTTKKEAKCPSDYTLDGSECTKTIDATLK